VLFISVFIKNEITILKSVIMNPKPRTSKDAKLQKQQAELNDALHDANLKINENKAKGVFYGGSDVIQPPLEFSSFPFGNFYGDEASGSSRYGLMYGDSQYRNKSENFYHCLIAACNEAYQSVGVVRTIINLLADFTAEEIVISHPDQSVQNFYKAWATQVNLKERLVRFTIDLLSAGQTFIWRTEAMLTDKQKRTLQRSKSASKTTDGLLLQSNNDTETYVQPLENTQSILLPNQSTAETVKIPWGYVSLNPLQMSMRGERFIGDNYWVMLLDKTSAHSITKYLSKSPKGSEINVPREIKNTDEKDKKTFTHEWQLDANRLYVIQDQSKKDYEIWATSIIYPALDPIRRKKLYTAGEQSALEAIKRTITLIKLGNTLEGFAPTPAKIARVADALAGGGQAHHLVWDDLIKGELIQPQLGDILDPQKYEAVNEDIFVSLGLSQSVMQGDGSYANSFLAVKLLLEKLETIRNQLAGWLMKELKVIAEALKFRTLPIVRFGKMNLRDENVERKLILDLYDRGILSKQALLDYFDEDFEVELERKKQEKEQLGSTKLMEDRGPYIKPPLDKMALNKSGRPPMTGKPLQKKRNTKPRGMGSLLKYNQYLQYAQKTLQDIQNQICAEYVAKANVKDYRSLDKITKAEVENKIYQQLAIQSPQEGLVYNEDVKQNILKTYEEVNKLDLSKEKREELFCSIYSLAWINQSENQNEITGTSEESI